MKVLISILFVFIWGIGLTQNTYQLGVLPSFNLNKKLSAQWKTNLKIESRQSLKEGFFKESNQVQYEYVLTDFTLILAKKVGLGNTLSGGYTLRLREGDLIHRSIQQFTVVRKFSEYRLAHRLSTDQTFIKDEPVEFRLRYRLTLEFALAGQSVNPKEFYLKINNEYLNILQDKDYDLEIRFVPFLGYKFTDENKLEMGLDYRLDSFVNKGGSRNRFWGILSWFIVL